MRSERKAAVGLDHVFWWQAPGGPTTGTPTMRIRMAAGDAAPVLAQIHADATVSAVASDRRTITTTASIGPSARGLIGRLGHAWLDAGEAGVVPVKILTFTTAKTAVLADPLPHAVTVQAGGATLAWEVWYATLTAAAVTSAAERNMQWRVRYQIQHGADAPAEWMQDEGLIHVVRQAFATGADDAGIRNLAAVLGRSLPARQESWTPQIELAQIELERELRKRLRPWGMYEDDLQGSAFSLAHGWLALSYIHAGQRSGGADTEGPRDYARERYEDELDRVLASVPWLDIDRDGVVDADEIDLYAGPPSMATGEFADSTISDMEDAGWVQAGVADDR